MPTLPENVINAWQDRKGPIVLTTVDAQGQPNAIYATCVGNFKNQAIVVADNYFDKTRKNILAGSKGSILFITNDGKAFQIKGTIQYLKQGEIFDDMKAWNGSKHPGHAAAAIQIEEIYSGAEKIL